MKSLMNEYVEHIKFGRGLIISEEAEKITVEFAEQSGFKMFHFPDAFEQYLKFENSVLQEESLILLQNKKQQIAEENEKRKLEFQRQEEIRRLEELEQKKKYKRSSKVKKINGAKDMSVDRVGKD